MKTQYTKGPWRMGAETENVVRIYPQNSAQAIAGAVGDNALNDARLIAAAPELLEALDKLLSDHKAMTKEVEFLRRQKIPAIKENILHTHCDQVIKKARGES